MSVSGVVVDAGRNGYENVGGLIVVSLGAALASVPVAVAGVVGTAAAVLGGLWATSLLLGVVVVAGFRFAHAVATRGVSVGLRSTVAPAVTDPVPGLKLGAATFVVLAGAGAAALAVPAAYRPVGVGFAAFSLTLWYLVVAFAAPELGTGRRVVPALRAGVARLVAAPGTAVAFLVLTALCTVAAGVTVVTTALLLPGALLLLAAQTTAEIDANAGR
jgi:hypothetical protein